MTQGGAEKAVITSSLVVAGVYAYRMFTEGTGPPARGTTKLSQIAGTGTPPPLETFVTAWGATFLVLAMLAQIGDGGLGAAMAILVATGDLLNNTRQVAADVNTKLGATSKAAASSPPAGSGVAPGLPSGQQVNIATGAVSR